MAREYARVKVTIWADPDFRTLSPGAQHLYFLLLTSASLNLAGVADWRPGRLAQMSSGWTVNAVKKAGAELEARRYIVIDEASEEVLVRSFVRHDGVLKSPNIAASMVKDYASIGSVEIMRVVAEEVRRAASEDPTLKGLPSVRELLSEPMSNQVGTLPREFPSSSPIPQPTTSNQQPATSNQQPATPGDPEGFEEFWSLYPKKASKGHALKAWRAATRTTDPRVILTGLRRQARALAGREPKFIPYPATWLNGQRWEDEAGPTERSAWDRATQVLPPPPPEWGAPA